MLVKDLREAHYLGSNRLQRTAEGGYDLREAHCPGSNRLQRTAEGRYGVRASTHVSSQFTRTK